MARLSVFAPSWFTQLRPFARSRRDRLGRLCRAVVETMESRVLLSAALTAGPGFFGPLAGWLVAPAATGDPNTDTANLQNDLNLVGTQGNSNTLYLPAGTYSINQSLVFHGKSEVTVVGADPSTTIIQWAGGVSPTGSAQSMLIDYGNTITQVNRITLDGQGQAAIGIADGYRPGAGLSQTGALGTLGNSSASGFYGVSFTTQNAVEKVSQLQMWVPANTTTSQAHMVELVDASTGNVVPNGSLTIAAGRNGGTNGVWITNNLAADAVLSPDHTYYLVVQEFNGGDSWYSDATPMAPDYVTVSSVNGSVSNTGGSFGVVTPGNHAFGPVNFKLDTTGNFFPTNNQFLYDHLTSFSNVGFDVGTSGQAAETTLEGCQFSYCGVNNNNNPIGSGGGVYLFGQNTIDWWIRNCQFDHDSVGIATNFGGYSMDVDNSIFSNNTLMDVYLPSGYSSAIRNSTSLDSAQFVGGGSGTGVILQNDTIIDPTSTTVPPINLQDSQLTLLNTTIRNNASYTGADAAVLNGGDILSFGNTIGTSNPATFNPYLYSGTAVLDAQGNQVVALNAPQMANLAPQTLPPAPSLSNLPVIELTPTGVANTDTANIQNAIATAKTDIDNGAAGAVIHLRGGLTTNNISGSFNINATLVIPAGYAIELLGDGATYQGSGNSGTTLFWSGPRGGTMIDLGGATLGVAAGPSCATLAAMGVLGGDSAGDGIRVENADQAGGNVYSDFSMASTDGNDTPAIYTQTGLLVDGLSSTNVQMADFNADAQYSVKAIGNGSYGSGGQVGVFMGAGASTDVQYDVSNFGKLLVEDQYLEEDTGDTNQFAHVDNSAYTIQGAEIKANVSGVDAANPPISISGTSQVNVLSAESAAGIILEPGSTPSLLAAGDGQWTTVSGDSNQLGPFAGPLDYAANAKVALLANGNTIDQVNNNVGNLSAFLQQMLGQTLNYRVQPLPVTPSRTVTDVRLYGVDIVSFTNDIHLIGSSPAAAHSNPPTPSTPAAPTGVIAQTSGAGGNQIELSFTPGGEHLIAPNASLALSNAHNIQSVNNFTGSVGTQFTTGPEPITVTQLGRFVLPGNSQAHLLQLIQASNLNVLGSATLQTSGAQADAFGYASLATPVTLAPNTTYYLVSAETAGGDQYIAATTVNSTSIVKSIDAAGTFKNNSWTQTGASGANYDLAGGPLDLVANVPPRLSGEGLTNGITTGGLLPVTSNLAFQGMQFTTGPNALTVADLGRWIVKNTTTTQSHILELIDPSNGNAVVASTVLSAGQSGGANGQFAYAALSSPVTLAANHHYYLVSQEFNSAGSDQTYASNTQMTPSGLIASTDGSVSYNGAAWTFNPDPTTTSEVYHFTYGPLDLLAAVDASPVTYTIYRSSDPTGASATVLASNLTTTSFIDSNPNPGVNYYTVLASNASGASTSLGQASASLGTALPNGWSDVNIGSPAPSGSAWTNNGDANSFTLQGNGSQMSQWNYAYEPIAGGSSFTETARVDLLDWAQHAAQGYDEFRGALMIRNGLSGVGNGVGFVDVSASFAELNGTNGTINVTAPVWLQLRAAYTASGNYYTISGFYSNDGVIWHAAGINAPSVIGAAGTMYIGLAVNSYATVGTTTASFSHVSVIDPSIAVPAAPTNPSATAANGSNAINLLWTAPPGTINSYDLYRSVTPGGEGSTPYISGLLGPSYQDSNITSGVTYYYTVAAVDEGGVGAQSAERSAATASNRIIGSVFNDANNNASRDGGETGLAGVSVTLSPTGSTTGSPVTIATASDGSYEFDNVPAGTYQIAETLLSGYALTAPVGGVAAVNVNAGSTVAGPVFGEVLISSVNLNFNMLVALSQDYNKPGTFANGDLNGSGLVDFNDLVLLSQNYNKTLPPGSYAGSSSTSAKSPVAEMPSVSSASPARAHGADHAFSRASRRAHPAAAISPATIYAVRAADPHDSTRDVVTFYAINNGVGAFTGTTKLTAEDITLTSGKGLQIRAYDADGAGIDHAADLAGKYAILRASYVRLGGQAFDEVSSSSSSTTGIFSDYQSLHSFEVAGALLGGGVVAATPGGVRIAVAVVPHGAAVKLVGNLAAEKGAAVAVSYTA